MRKNPAVLDIDRMPRGGPDASWVDRRLQTDHLEYLDRGDVDDRVKRQVVRSLERLGSVFKDHEKFARLALDEVAGGVPAADGRPPICPRSRHQLAAGLQPLGDAGTGPIRRPDHPAATSQAAAVGPPDRCRQPPRLAASTQLPVAH